MKITRAGVDIAKSVFHVHGVDCQDKPVSQIKLKRGQLLDALWTRLVPGAEVGMEAADLRYLDDRIYSLDEWIGRSVKNDPMARRLLVLRGVGPLIRRIFNVVETVQENELKAFHPIRSPRLSCKQIGKGSDRVKQNEASKLLRRFKKAFSEQTITALGRSTGFFKRKRKMTPMKMMMSLLSCFVGGQNTTLADVQRSYNALSPASMAYKPFHNQLSKAAFARFMQELASHVLSTLVLEVLKPSRAGLLAEFERILIQDGSSFAVKDALHRHYPGRFTPVSPAAVELHVTWNLCLESIEQVVLTPYTFTERAELPPADSLRGDLPLADGGYFDRDYLRAVAAHGGHFLVHAQNSINPVIEAVHSGPRASRVVGHALKDVRNRL